MTRAEVAALSDAELKAFAETFAEGEILPDVFDDIPSDRLWKVAGILQWDAEEFAAVDARAARDGVSLGEAHLMMMEDNYIYFEEFSKRVGLSPHTLSSMPVWCSYPLVVGLSIGLGIYYIIRSCCQLVVINLMKFCMRLKFGKAATKRIFDEFHERAEQKVEQEERWSQTRETWELEQKRNDLKARMTQTGSMGLISAASPRHPRPNAFMMGILKDLHKSPGVAALLPRTPVPHTMPPDSARLPRRDRLGSIRSIRAPESKRSPKPGGPIYSEASRLATRPLQNPKHEMAMRWPEV
jgi:hypothetical protein